jgi:tripartite-type tricarboxylate transporter receptor subunit TctC
MTRFGRIRWAVLFLSLYAVFSVCLSNTWAQPYPAKPVNMLIGWGAGGTVDITLRILCESAGKTLGQPFVVVNKPGGGSAVALAMLKNEPPDGYSLGNLSPAGMLSQFMRKIPYDVMTDFTPIMRYGDYSYGVVVRADSPWKSFKELINYAKANPGKIRYSSAGAGTFHHLAMEALAKQEGIKWIHIPYKGGHEATTALLGGHVEVQASASEWKPSVESGKLRLVSTYNPDRLPKYPDVPTWMELGYGIGASGYIGILGPKGLPRPIVEKLHGAFKLAMEEPAFKKAMDTYDMPVVYRDPDGLAKDIKGFCEKWGKLIVELGIKEE